MTADGPPSGARNFLRRDISGFVRFSAIAMQFALVVVIIGYWQIESVALLRLMQLSFVGFLINHFLPVRFRLRFFAVLSLVVTVTVLDEAGTGTFIGALTGRVSLNTVLYQLAPGLILISIGLVLIALCHIPIRFGARLGLLVAIGAGLAILRAHSAWFTDVTAVWPILGSMFIFRLMVYLYDLKHRLAPFSAAHAISYFFMVPNVCFPLFPVVDYRTFCSTHYNEDWTRVYQTGLKWMVRGVVHLLLYRAVYQFAPLDVSKLSSLMDVVGFMAATYLLYLRISGSFHLIVGLLLMFGFNLPETHHLYLLASSFSDFWRRINIYWKDFVLKLFFYPAYFAVRRIGILRAISLATLTTFFATWLLHSWQWFWIRGSLLFTWQDISFWAILATLVLVNGLYEARYGQRRTLTTAGLTVGGRLIVGLQTIGTFTVICTLWTVWSCQSWGELQALADAASRPTGREIAVLVVGLAVVGASGMLWGRSTRETSEGPSLPRARVPFEFWNSAVGVGAAAVCLLVGPSIVTHTFSDAGPTVTGLRRDSWNARDMSVQRRGYYEELDEKGVNHRRRHWVEAPEGWRAGFKVFFRQRADFLMSEIVPSTSTSFSGTRVTSNRFGMRDREYEKMKPINTYRFVLLGSSHEMGMGVKDDETFENLVEDRLNSRHEGLGYSRYEILNLSKAGDSVLQRVLRLEQSGFEFDPDAAILSVAAVDSEFVLQHLQASLARGIEPPSGYFEPLAAVMTKARVHGKMPDLMITRRLTPYVPEIFRWAFQRFKVQCAQRSVHPLVIYRPAPDDSARLESAGRKEMLSIARATGLEAIDLSAAFDSVVDRNALIVANWDYHTDALGHRLLAERLYEAIAQLLASRRATSSSTDQ
jgi:hypothetical protein